jgi:hypothetical protein
MTSPNDQFAAEREREQQIAQEDAARRDAEGLREDATAAPPAAAGPSDHELVSEPAADGPDAMAGDATFDRSSAVADDRQGYGSRDPDLAPDVAAQESQREGEAATLDPGDPSMQREEAQREERGDREVVAGDVVEDRAGTDMTAEDVVPARTDEVASDEPYAATEDTYVTDHDRADQEMANQEMADQEMADRGVAAQDMANGRAEVAGEALADASTEDMSDAARARGVDNAPPAGDREAFPITESLAGGTMVAPYAATVPGEPAVGEHPVEDASGAGERAAEAVDEGTDGQVDGDSGLHPGEAGIAPVVVGPTSDEAAGVHGRWQEVQLGFIDDPRAAAEQARAIVSDAIEAHIASLRQNLDRLDGWQGSQSPDTELLRAAVQGYRDLLGKLTRA